MILGKITQKIRFLWSRHKSRLKRVAGALVVLSVLVFALIPSPVEQAKDFACSKVLLDKKGRPYHMALSSDGEWLIPVPLSEMNPWLLKVAVAIEDKRYYDHHGVDPLALGRAISQNISRGGVVSGASTITVQVVRLSHPRPRTISSKFIEFVQAVKLDWSLEKEEILEIYLNRAPFGGNIRGVEAASRIYFNKSARNLSLGESSLLIAVLRGPSIYRPDKHPQRAKKRRDFVLDLLLAKGVATETQVKAAKAEPVTARRGVPPKLAWHFSQKALNQISQEAWNWNNFNRMAYGVQTTLDLDVQHSLEQKLKIGLNGFPQRVTAAALVLDNHDQSVLAYVGNQRFGDNYKNSWVDCGDSPRSPGSVLKPFVYLEAFNRNQLTLNSLLADTPLKLGGEAPRNFTEKYRGPVSAKAALAESLNAPAVRVLRLVGPETALAGLRNLGFTYLNRPASYYGDSLVIGGCEINMWQLAKAYGTLAREGRETNLAVIKKYPLEIDKKSEPQVLSSGAAWMVTEALRDESRLSPQLKMARAETKRGLAFKTGTSYGLRDAWLAAYDLDHTLVLWFGDPSGRSHKDLVALQSLGPVAVNFMKTGLNRPDTSAWFRKPDSVEPFVACAVSGEPAGAFCPHRISSYRLAEGAKSHPCRLHVRQGRQVATQWPREVGEFLAVKAKLADTMPLAITSPLPQSRIIIKNNNLDKAASVNLPLKCEGAEGEVYWYVNNEFFGKQEGALSPVISVPPGRHSISVTDGRGRIAKTEFTVMWPFENPAPTPPKLKFEVSENKEK